MSAFPELLPGMRFQCCIYFVITQAISETRGCFSAHPQSVQLGLLFSREQTSRARQSEAKPALPRRRCSQPFALWVAGLPFPSPLSSLEMLLLPSSDSAFSPFPSIYSCHSTTFGGLFQTSPAPSSNGKRGRLKSSKCQYLSLNPHLVISHDYQLGKYVLTK